MNIPKQVQIGSQTITIEVNDMISYDNELASARNALNKIELCIKYRNDELPIDMIEQSLWHEIIHHILYKMNEFELTGNEKFVQTFSLLIHQAIKTLK